MMTASSSSSSSVKVELLERADEYVVATWRRIMLLAWRGQATATGVERSSALFEAWVKRQPGGGVFLIVVPRHYTRPPDEAARAAMKRVARTPEGPAKGVATLVETEGFIAASVRAIMVRLSYLGTQGPPPNIFRTTAETALWAAVVLQDREVTQEGLAEAIRVAREV